MLLKALKTLFCALLVAVLPAARPVLAAGTIPLAMSVQFDTSGNVAANCQLTLLQAGTVGTKQNGFADFGLTTALPNPMNCDQSGRLPMFWLADGLIHATLTDSFGNVIVDVTMQVLGPSSGGGGGGGTVDPTTLYTTGDLKVRYGTGAIPGFVRANGLTIGNATCGCSERANADTQNLFVFLYNIDPNLAVSGGRTGNALNDFNANKQLTLPDWRGRAIAALDDMGNSAAGRLTSTYFGTAATVLGAGGGVQFGQLVGNQIPTIVGNNSNAPTYVGTQNNGFTPVSNVNTIGSAFGASGVNITGIQAGTLAATQVTASTTIALNTLNFQSANTSGSTQGQPVSLVQPTMLATIYIRL